MHLEVMVNKIMNLKRLLVGLNVQGINDILELMSPNVVSSKNNFVTFNKNIIDRGLVDDLNYIVKIYSLDIVTHRTKHMEEINTIMDTMKIDNSIAPDSYLEYKRLNNFDMSVYEICLLIDVASVELERQKN